MSFQHGGTLFEDHAHPDRAHRHELGEVAFPRGFITLWYGVSTATPTGWAVCDGTNGTPDMRGRVPVGVDTGQTEFDTLGEAGGANTHALTIAELAVHTHVQNPHAHQQQFGNGAGAVSSVQFQANLAVPAGVNNTANQTATNQNTGSGSAHNNLQPYRALHFIMKL